MLSGQFETLAYSNNTKQYLHFEHYISINFNFYPLIWQVCVESKIYNNTQYSTT